MTYAEEREAYEKVGAEIRSASSELTWEQLGQLAVAAVRRHFPVSAQTVISHHIDTVNL